MGWILTIIIGAIVGWLYSYAVRPERRNYWADIIAGAVGAIVGLWFFANLLGLGTPLTTDIGTITLLGVVWSVLGAVIVTAVVQAALMTGEERQPSYYQEMRERRRKDDDRDNR